MEFKIKELRKNLNLTQEELSEKSGVGRITISRLESGELKETTLGTLSKLSKALGVTIDELVRQ